MSEPRFHELIEAEFAAVGGGGRLEGAINDLQVALRAEFPLSVDQLDRLEDRLIEFVGEIVGMVAARRAALPEQPEKPEPVKPTDQPPTTPADAPAATSADPVNPPTE